MSHVLTCVTWQSLLHSSFVMCCAVLQSDAEKQRQSAAGSSTTSSAGEFKPPPQETLRRKRRERPSSIPIPADASSASPTLSPRGPSKRALTAAKPPLHPSPLGGSQDNVIPIPWTRTFYVSNLAHPPFPHPGPPPPPTPYSPTALHHAFPSVCCVCLAWIGMTYFVNSSSFEFFFSNRYTSCFQALRIVWHCNTVKY